jgi:hypothetical protein
VCLEYALESKERFGIWGGKSERERARIAKQRRREKPKKAKRAWPSRKIQSRPFPNLRG